MSKVKICGLSRMEDIAAVNFALPDFIGFVFAKSRRRVSMEKAALLKEKLDPQIKAVGVFVNEDIQTIAQICRLGILDLIQLHGQEDDGYIKRLRSKCDCKIIKAIGVSDGLLNGLSYGLPTVPENADFLLFDSLSPQLGGTGKTFDWNILNGYRGMPYFLAGGLSVDTVPSAIQQLSPFCVDVSSGVETNGLKDSKKIEAFICAARESL